MMALALLPLVLSFCFVKIIKPKELKGSMLNFFSPKFHYDFYKTGVTTNKMLVLNVVVSIAHTVRCLDPSAFAGRLSVETTQAFFSGVWYLASERVVRTKNEVRTTDTSKTP